MKKEDNFIFASITKLHGFKGSFLVKIIQPLSESKLKKMESVFLELEGQLVPFFIESISRKNAEWLYIKFVGIDDEPNAKKLIRANIWLPVTMLPKTKGNSFNKDELMNFMVSDQKYGQIGIVSRIIEMPHYPLLEIVGENKKEILIPAAGDIIKKIDRKAKVIFIEAPEGLIEMYLQ